MLERLVPELAMRKQQLDDSQYIDDRMESVEETIASSLSQRLVAGHASSTTTGTPDAYPRSAVIVNDKIDGMGSVAFGDEYVSGHFGKYWEGHESNGFSHAIHLKHTHHRRCYLIVGSLD